MKKNTPLKPSNIKKYLDRYGVQNDSNAVKNGILFPVLQHQAKKLETGLFILPAPTGMGKTHSAEALIADMLIDWEKAEADQAYISKYPYKRVFFVTLLKDNIPDDRLHNRLNKMGREDLFDQKVLRLDSITVHIKEKLKQYNASSSLTRKQKQKKNYQNGFDDLYCWYEDNEKEFSRYLTIKTLNDLTGAFNDLSDDKNSLSKNVAESLNKVFLEAEKEFRKEVRKACKKRINEMLKSEQEELPEKEQKKYEDLDENQRLFYIRQAGWNWVIDLYPGCLIFERPIVMMTLDKLLNVHDPIISKIINFFADDYLNNSLLFLDEFDSAFESIMKSKVIEAVISGSNDLYRMARYIYDAFFDPSPDKEMTDTLKISRQYISLERKVKDAEDKFHISRFIKVIWNDEEMSNEFMFSGHYTYHLSGNAKYYVVFTDDEKKKNFVRILDSKKDRELLDTVRSYKEKMESKEEVPYFLEISVNSVRGLITSLEYALVDFAQLYISEKKKNRMRDISLEDAIESILKGLHINDKEEIRFLKQEISHLFTKKNSIMHSAYDSSDFYKTGFQLLMFTDSDSQMESTTISKMQLYGYPEATLLQLCQKCKVIGMSATALHTSILHNFDLEWLQTELGDQYQTLSDTDLDALNEYMELYYQNMFPPEVSFVTNLHYQDTVVRRANNSQVDREDNLKLLDQLKEPESLIDKEELKPYLDYLYAKENNNEFTAAKYLRILYVFLQFLQNREIHSFVCMGQSCPNETSNSFNIHAIEQIFLETVNLLNKKSNPKRIIHFLTPEDLNFKTPAQLKAKAKKIKDILVLTINSADLREKAKVDFYEEVLRQGKYVFLFTAYASMGTGRDMKYKYGEKEELTCISADTPYTQYCQSESYTDFDAIYLDCPTHIVQGIDKNAKDEERKNAMILRMAQIERLCHEGDISAAEDRKFIIETAQEGLRVPLDAENTKAIQSKFKKTHAYGESVCQIVTQAVGRIDRTSMRSKQYIWLDEELKLRCSTEALGRSDIISSPVIKAVLETIQSQQAQTGYHPALSNNETRMKNLASSVTRDAARLIEKVIIENRGLTNKENQVKYKEHNEFVLKHPTLTREKRNTLLLENNEVLGKFYVLLPKPANTYWCKVSNDNSVLNDISFTYPYGSQGYMEVSAKDAKLPDLLRIEGVKEAMEARGFPNEWKPGDFIMPPNLFKNYYKGRVGEIAGDVILTKWGLTLQKMPEGEFEVFDAYDPVHEVYVDYKNFNESFHQDEKSVVEHVFSKLKGKTCSKVIICNVLANIPNQYEAKTYTKDGMQILVLPYLYGKSEEGTSAVLENTQARLKLYEFINPLIQNDIRKEDGDDC
jgi:hypothetical protein